MVLIVLIGAATCSFVVLHAIPGDTAQAIAGPQATMEDVERLRASMGLDKPLTEQYKSYIIGLCHGNLGFSYHNGKPVWDLVAAAWPNTMRLALSSMLVAILLGIPLGVLAAVKRGRVADTISMVIAFIGISMPSFWLALLLILLFCVNLNLVPFYGIQGWQSYILPSVTLGVHAAASIARMTRTGMLEVLGQDYIRTARGKGLQESRVVFLHALRNAAISIVTIIGLQFGILLGGQVVTETIFSWPGIGRMIVDALNSRDLQIVQGGILILACTFAVINLLTDLLYGILDPRIRYN